MAERETVPRDHPLRSGATRPAEMKGCSSSSAESRHCRVQSTSISPHRDHHRIGATIVVVVESVREVRARHYPITQRTQEKFLFDMSTGINEIARPQVDVNQTRIEAGNHCFCVYLANLRVILKETIS
jgi:hypothetical protein